MKNFNLIKKAVSIVTPKSTVLPILECVLIKDGNLTVTDLNTTIVFKDVGIDLEFVQNAKDFVKACGFVENPAFVKDDFKLTISNSEEKFTYRCGEIGDFPKVEAKDAIVAGTISVKDCAIIKRALAVVGNDELRPAMCAVCIKDGFIMGTNGICAIYERSDFYNSNQILIGKKSARLMAMFPKSDFVVSVSQTHLIIENDIAVILQRIDDNRFPDLLSIVPKEHAIEMSVDKKDFVKAVIKAHTCAEKITHAVMLGLNGRLTISSEDRMNDCAYKRQISCEHTGPNVDVWLNANLLLNIVNTISDPELKFSMTSANKAVVLNNSSLQMPVNISQNR